MMIKTYISVQFYICLRMLWVEMLLNDSSFMILCFCLPVFLQPSPAMSPRPIQFGEGG